MTYVSLKRIFPVQSYMNPRNMLWKPDTLLPCTPTFENAIPLLENVILTPDL